MRYLLHKTFFEAEFCDSALIFRHLKKTYGQSDGREKLKGKTGAHD